MPGRLSGPRRLGTLSYTHSLPRLIQFWQFGRVESQRILRDRLVKGTAQFYKNMSFWERDFLINKGEGRLRTIVDRQ